MQPQSSTDYKQLLTEVIKKQIVILGPDITLSKARNVKGLTIADDGTVTNVEGAPQEVTQALIDQFVQLSGLIVKKTMEPLLSMSGGFVPEATSGTIQSPTSPASKATNEPLSVPVTDNMIPSPVIANEVKQPSPQEIATSQAPRNDVVTDTPVQINVNGDAAATPATAQTAPPVIPSTVEGSQSTNRDSSPSIANDNSIPTPTVVPSQPVVANATLEPAKNPLAA